MEAYSLFLWDTMGHSLKEWTPINHPKHLRLIQGNEN